jgi:MGT family glycosyltransferase
MAKFLFIEPPFMGHMNPARSVAAQLKDKGHEVAWVGYPSILNKLVAGERIFYVSDDALNQRLKRHTAIHGQSRGHTLGFEGFKFLIDEVLIPICHDMLPVALAAIEQYAPDVVITDQQAFAGAIGAQLKACKWATLCTSSASVTQHHPTLERIQADFADLIRKEQMRAGIAESRLFACTPFPESSSLVIIFTARELVERETPFPASYQFVGAAIQNRVETAHFPWERLKDDRPRLLVSLGTVNPNEGARFYQEVIHALAKEALQVIMVAPEELLHVHGALIPDNFIVTPFIPQLAVLKRVQAVISHGGHNTVMEALTQGLPLVIAPITDDQPVIADYVAKAGVGVRINFRRSKAATIREAVLRILSEPSFGEAARRMQQALTTAGGPERAAELLIELAGGPKTTSHLPPAC